MSPRKATAASNIAIHGILACLVLFAPTWVVFGEPVWNAPDANLRIALGLCAAYIVAVGTGEIAPAFGYPRQLVALGSAAIVIALLYLSLLVAPTQNFSRLALLAGTGLCATGLFSAFAFPALDERVALRFALISALAAGVIGSSFLLRSPLERQTTRNGSQQRTETLPASQHILSATHYRDFLRPESPRVYGGAIAVDQERSRYILVRPRGEMYSFYWKDNDLHTEDLHVRVPINNGDFEADADPAVATSAFRVADVVVQRRDGVTRVYVSHHYWKHEENCFVVRVSELAVPTLDVARDYYWRTVFESAPCLKMKIARGGRFAGEQIGGNLEFLDDGKLLLTVGDHQFDGWYGEPNLVQDTASDYGKTVLIDLASSTWSVFTLGHRNPQGLVVDSAGRIWSTEHGPQGGDELNLLRAGGNYGYPFQTYGTDYGSVKWPPGEGLAPGARYTPPVFAWVPSIGISDLVTIRDDDFGSWSGDLLVASLAGKTLWRVRLRDQTVVYTEPIAIGERIRDIVAGDGEFVLWTDQDSLVRLRPLKALDAGSEVFAVRCGGCHDDNQHRIGPNLGGIFDRDVAAADGYNYSESLRGLGGRWTEERLESFLQNPRAFAPGTTMAVEGVTDQEDRRQLIEYLKYAY